MGRDYELAIDNLILNARAGVRVRHAQGPCTVGMNVRFFRVRLRGAYANSVRRSALNRHGVPTLRAASRIVNWSRGYFRDVELCDIDSTGTAPGIR